MTPNALVLKLFRKSGAGVGCDAFPLRVAVLRNRVTELFNEPPAFKINFNATTVVYMFNL